ncbi:MAG: VCBS repeat-containing protein, partial [Sphingobacteriales bacterium]
YKTGPQPGFVSVNDLDGDGKPDVVLMNAGYNDVRNGNNSLTIFYNKSISGKIKLAAAVVTDSTETAPASYNIQLRYGDNVVRITDIDGDGKPDIVILNTGGSISIYRNIYVAGQPVKNTFAPPVTIPLELLPNTFIIGDMDNDGKPDIVATNAGKSSISVLRNTSSGSITPSSFQRIDFPLGYRPVAVSLADIDGDGKLDVVIGRADNKTNVVHNTSVPGFFNGVNISLQNLTAYSNYNDDISMQDVNGDGKPDLGSLNADLNAVNLYINKSTPGQTSAAYFNSEANCPVATIPDCVGDLDGDGLPDMIVGSIFGLDIYRGKSSLVPRIAPQQVIAEVAKGDMMIYPNPATISTNVKYTLPLQSDALISVYNNYGQLIRSFNTGKQ